MRERVCSFGISLAVSWLASTLCVYVAAGRNRHRGSIQGAPGRPRSAHRCIGGRKTFPSIDQHTSRDATVTRKTGHLLYPAVGAVAFQVRLGNSPSIGRPWPHIHSTKRSSRSDWERTI
jgi:hypothetical protein